MPLRLVRLWSLAENTTLPLVHRENVNVRCKIRSPINNLCLPTRPIDVTIADWQ